MKVARNLLCTMALLVAPAAHAQCTEAPGGLAGWLDSLLDIFRTRKIKFDSAPPNGAGPTTTGEIEIKEVNCGGTTMNVRIAKGVAVKEEGKSGNYGGGAEVRTGVAVEYELTMPNKDWEKMSTPPNPLDPASLPPGGSMVLRREYFASLGLEGQYKKIVAASGYEEGSGVVVVVTRNANGTTELSVGPYDVAKREGLLGIGAGNYKVGIGRDQKLENGTLTKYTFDPTKPEDVRDYQSVFGQGMTSPSGSVLSTRPSSKIEYATYESQFGVRGQGGPVSVGGNFIVDGADLRFETAPDGTVTGTATSSANGTTMTQKRVWKSAPPAERIGEDEITVSFTDTTNLYYLGLATGQKQGPNGFQIKLTEEGWKEWRDRAREYVAKDPVRNTFPMKDIAEAESAMDVAKTLYLIGANPTAGEEVGLAHIYAEDGRVLPGAAGAACDNPPADVAAAEESAEKMAKVWCGSNVDLWMPTAAVALPPRTGNGTAGTAIGAGMLRP